MNVRYSIRPKESEQKRTTPKNSRKITSRSTEIHNPSARRVTSDLALDSNKLNIVNAEAVYTEVWQKNSLSPLLSIYLPLRTIIQVDDRSAKSRRLNILQTLSAKAASSSVFRTGWGGHTPGNPRPSRLATRSRKPKQSTVQSIFAADFHRRD